MTTVNSVHEFSVAEVQKWRAYKTDETYWISVRLSNIRIRSSKNDPEKVWVCIQIETMSQESQIHHIGKNLDVHISIGTWAKPTENQEADWTKALARATKKLESCPYLDFDISLELTFSDRSHLIYSLIWSSPGSATLFAISQILTNMSGLRQLQFCPKSMSGPLQFHISVYQHSPIPETPECAIIKSLNSLGL